MLNDLRYGMRTLLGNPGFSIAAIIALALGIGANTAIFSCADAFLFKPLPLPGIQHALDTRQRKGFEEKCVSATEDGCIGADAEREGDDGRDAETGVAEQRAHSVAKVVEH